MTAAGLPASPGLVIPSDMPTLEELQASNRAAAQRIEFRETKVVWTPDEGFVKDSPSEDTLRHNFLLRRHLNDPGYGASREASWREKAANGLGVPCVPERARISRGPASFRGGVEKLVASPSDNPRRDLGLPSE